MHATSPLAPLSNCTTNPYRTGQTLIDDPSYLIDRLRANQGKDLFIFKDRWLPGITGWMAKVSSKRATQVSDSTKVNGTTEQSVVRADFIAFLDAPEYEEKYSEFVLASFAGLGEAIRVSMQRSCKRYLTAFNGDLCTKNQTPAMREFAAFRTSNNDHSERPFAVGKHIDHAQPDGLVVGNTLVEAGRDALAHGRVLPSSPQHRASHTRRRSAIEHHVPLGHQNVCHVSWYLRRLTQRRP